VPRASSKRALASPRGPLGGEVARCGDDAGGGENKERRRREPDAEPVARQEACQPVTDGCGSRLHGQALLPTPDVGGEGGDAAVALRLLGCGSFAGNLLEVALAAAGDERAEDHTEREHIVGDDRVSAREPRRARICPGHRHLLRCRRIGLAVEQPGDAEIEQLHPSVLRHEDVRWLQIGVNHEPAVRELHRIRCLQEDRDPLAEAAPLQRVVDRHALNILHDEVGDAALGNAAVDQPGDPRMLEPGEDAPLFAEAFGDERREVGVDQLDRDFLLVKAVVAQPAPDLAHAADADAAFEAERPDAVRRRDRLPVAARIVGRH